ncbi:MAG: hypothetical protein AB7K24_05785 [Gemmataceae bacterium]
MSEVFEQFEQVPDARTYVHEACGGSTVISGDEYTGLCHPNIGFEQTLCAACKSYDRLSRFRWQDTDERLTDYRKRIKRSVPDALRFRGSVWTWLIGFAAGSLIAGLLRLLTGSSVAMWIGGGICVALACFIYVKAMLEMDKITWKQFR